MLDRKKGGGWSSRGPHAAEGCSCRQGNRQRARLARYSACTSAQAPQRSWEGTFVSPTHDNKLPRFPAGSENQGVMYYGAMDVVVSLKEARSKEMYGGKAANLSRLLSADLPVPSGFAIGIQAFKGGELTIEASNKIQCLIEPTKTYAVRSSAISEDSQDASWAGQFETFLNVAPRDVHTKIKECHGTTKARASAYGKQMRDEKDFEVAVVVQEMLVPDHAGVLFTRNPVTGADEFVIEYIRGIGEALVGGKADPDRIVVREKVDVEAPFDIEKLVSLAKSAETKFGCPQDIEFASANGKIWLLQARPITTLK